MPSWIEAHRKRCGPFTDAALLFGASMGVEVDPPAGARGLLVLTRAIERYVRDEHEERDERLFIERAGAYLGLLLCDALGQGEHEERDGHHGLRLGDRGFFDPFVAIEHALAADDVCRTLAAEVALAERMLAAGASDADARFRARRWAALAPQILPRVVGPGFFARLGRGAAERLCVEAFAGEVQLCFALRNGSHVRYLRRDELRELSRDTERVAGVAVSNLARASKNARFLRVDTQQGPLVVAQSGDNLDAARILLPGLYDVLAPELGAPFAVAIPHRDSLLACSASNPQALAALRERARQEAARAQLAITTELFVVTAPGRVTALKGR